MTPLISICIPTNNRVEILRKTLNSILSQGVSEELFEICISDNSVTNETSELIQNEYKEVQNISYNKVDCKGFMNSTEALKLGSGKYLKLHNDYTMLKPDSLNEMIKTIQSADENSVIFWAGNALHTKNKTSLNSFDSFLNKISINSTWSSSFGIWKEQFQNSVNITNLDKMFPHTDILFQLTSASIYYVDDSDYFDNQDLKKKGGYNLPDNFGNIFLGMIDKLQNNHLISKKTSKKIYSQILKFIALWKVQQNFNKEKYSFDFSNLYELIRTKWNRPSILIFSIYEFFFTCKNIIKKLLKR